MQDISSRDAISSRCILGVWGEQMDAADREREVLEVFPTTRWDRRAALKFPKRAMKRYSPPQAIVTDRQQSYGAAMKVIRMLADKRSGVGATTGRDTHTSIFERERLMARFRDIKALQKLESIPASKHQNHLRSGGRP